MSNRWDNRHEEDHDYGTDRRLGGGMIVAAWVVVIGLVTALFSGWIDRQWNPNASVESTVRSDGVRQVVLEQNNAGHYVATGRINGEAVVFLLDTGATEVSVPGRLADELGLERMAPGLARTANGVVRTWSTKLDRVALGDIVLRDVRAHINPAMDGGDVLLGMSFLRQLELVQRGNTLTLRQPPPGA